MANYAFLSVLECFHFKVKRLLQKTALMIGYTHKMKNFRETIPVRAL